MKNIFKLLLVGILLLCSNIAISDDKTFTSYLKYISPDVDNDTIANEYDVCPLFPNKQQYDSDNDGLGDACDADLADTDGDGYFEIYSPVHLASISSALTANYELANDIILNPATISTPMLWTPIGTDSAPFSGAFNGNGYKIGGLYVDSDHNAGLFGYIEEAIIENLGVYSTGVFSANNSGIIVGEAQNSILKNVYGIAAAEILANNYNGIIVGNAPGTSVINSYGIILNYVGSSKFSLVGAGGGLSNSYYALANRTDVLSTSLQEFPIVSAAELSCPVVGSALHCLTTADYADWDTSLWNINATGGRPLFHKKSAWGN